MKVLFYIVSFLTLLGSSSFKGVNALPDEKVPTPDDTSFTLADAEKILGETAHFTRGKTNKKTFSTIYQSSYVANGKDKKTGNIGELSYQLEWYKSDTGARRKFADIKRTNDKGDGVEALPGMGDEAFVHTDNETFYLIMVRKGAVLFRIKVEKWTSSVSSDAIEEIAENISDKI